MHLRKTSGIGGERPGHPLVLELALAPGAISLVSFFSDRGLSQIHVEGLIPYAIISGGEHGTLMNETQEG